MKPEPLTKYVIRAKCSCQHPDCEADGIESKFYREDWVKSSVEWLKEQINTKDCHIPLFCSEVHILHTLIDKAFEDVK